MHMYIHTYIDIYMCVYCIHFMTLNLEKKQILSCVLGLIIIISWTDDHPVSGRDLWLINCVCLSHCYQLEKTLNQVSLPRNS